MSLRLVPAGVSQLRRVGGDRGVAVVSHGGGV
jgi:hypothetical protein